jgi:phage shock protein PspC (stress-responsive transcriptional regulator)
MTTAAGMGAAREGAILAGVCARLGRRWGIDPLILRIAFVAGAFAGGGGIVVYIVVAVLQRVRYGEPGQVMLRPRAASWRLAAGVGLLVLSLLLAVRALGVPFSDAAVWPVVLTTSGVALLWRQSALPRHANGPRTL